MLAACQGYMRWSADCLMGLDVKQCFTYAGASVGLQDVKGFSRQILLRTGLQCSSTQTQAPMMLATHLW